MGSHGGGNSHRSPPLALPPRHPPGEQITPAHPAPAWLWLCCTLHSPVSSACRAASHSPLFSRCGSWDTLAKGTGRQRETGPVPAPTQPSRWPAKWATGEELRVPWLCREFVGPQRALCPKALYCSTGSLLQKESSIRKLSTDPAVRHLCFPRKPAGSQSSYFFALYVSEIKQWPHAL